MAFISRRDASICPGALRGIFRASRRITLARASASSRAFKTALFLQEMVAGATADKAAHAQCKAGATMTVDIDASIMNIGIGFAR